MTSGAMRAEGHSPHRMKLAVEVGEGGEKRSHAMGGRHGHGLC